MSSASSDDTNPNEAFAYHAAGIGGSGSSSYIDSVIMREKDANTGWTAASDGTLEERVFYVQNWRADVVALLDAAGNPLEEIRYTAYGSPSVHPIADVDGNGLVNAADVTAWTNLFAGSSTDTVYEHNNLNRDELFPGDTDDDTYFYARYATGTHGFNKLSSLGNRKGYAGYEWDQSATTWHVRHRVLDSASGKWTRMDPLGYVDGASVFEYAASDPIERFDTWGLRCEIGINGPTRFGWNVRGSRSWKSETWERTAWGDDFTEIERSLTMSFKSTASFRKTSNNTVVATMTSILNINTQSKFVTTAYGLPGAPPGRSTRWQSNSLKHESTHRFEILCDKTGIKERPPAFAQSSVWFNIADWNFGFVPPNARDELPVNTVLSTIQHALNVRQDNRGAPNYFTGLVDMSALGQATMFRGLRTGPGWGWEIGISPFPGPVQPGLEYGPGENRDGIESMGTLSLFHRFDNQMAQLVCKCHD